MIGALATRQFMIVGAASSYGMLGPMLSKAIVGMICSATVACGPTLKDTVRYSSTETDRVQLSDDGRYIFMWRTQRQLVSREYERPGLLTSERETVGFSTTDEVGRSSYVARLTVATEACTRVDPSVTEIPASRPKAPANSYRMETETDRGKHVVEANSGKTFAPSASYLGHGKKEHPYELYCFTDRDGHLWESQHPSSRGYFNLTSECPTPATSDWAAMEPLTSEWKEVRFEGYNSRSYVSVRVRIEPRELVWQTIDFTTDGDFRAFEIDWEVDSDKSQQKVRAEQRLSIGDSSPSWFRGTSLIVLDDKLLVVPNNAQFLIQARPLRVAGWPAPGIQAYIVSFGEVAYTLETQVGRSPDEAKTTLEPVRLPLGQIVDQTPDYLLTYTGGVPGGAHSSEYFWLFERRATPSWRMVSTMNCR